MLDNRRVFAEWVARGVPHAEAAHRAGYEPSTCPRTARSLMRDREVLDHIARCKLLASQEATTHTLPLPSDPPPDDSELRDPLIIPGSNGDSLAFLIAIMDNPRIDLTRRMDAAKTLVPFQHGKIGDAGKKKTQLKEAQVVAGQGGAYSPQSPPALRAVPR